MQAEERSLGNFRSNIEVDTVKYRCNFYCETPYVPTRSIRDNFKSVENTNGTTEWEMSSR